MATRTIASLLGLLALGACSSAPPVRPTLAPLPTTTGAAQQPRPVQFYESVPQQDQLFLNFALGRLNYTDRDYGPADDQVTFGISADWSRRGRWGFEVGGYFSDSFNKEFSDDGETFEAGGSAQEIYAGPRYNFATETIDAQPFVGWGLSYQWASRDGFDGAPNDVDDSNGGAVGFYAHAGVRWFIATSTTIGFDWRYLNGAGLDGFQFEDDTIRPDYHLFSFFLGLKF